MNIFFVIVFPMLICCVNIRKIDYKFESDQSKENLKISENQSKLNSFQLDKEKLIQEFLKNKSEEKEQKSSLLDKILNLKYIFGIKDEKKFTYYVKIKNGERILLEEKICIISREGNNKFKIRNIKNNRVNEEERVYPANNQGNNSNFSLKSKVQSALKDSAHK